MKRIISTTITLLLLCICMISAASAAGNGLTYDLTVEGSNSATVKTGDIITVTYTIHGGADYTVNAIQNEIKFDDSFFQLVDGSIQVQEGTGKYVEKIAGPRVYMNDVNTSYSAEQIVGTFQLKVIAASGSSTVESTQTKAYDGSGQAMQISAQNLSVVIAGTSGGGTSGGVSGGGTSGGASTQTGIRANVEEVNGSYQITFIDTGNNSTVDSLSEPIVVSVPAQNGNVVVIVNDDNSYTVLPKSLVENNTAYFLLDRPATIKIIHNSKSFTDVADNAWYKSAVDFVSSHELFNGVTTTEFAPLQLMNRAMLVTVLYRLDSLPNVRAAQQFSDVATGTWYTDAVIWGNENKIVEGYGNGLFGPNDYVTREQMAVFLYRYMKQLGLDVSAKDSLSSYADADKVSSWASEAMQWAVGSGIINGKGNGILDPTGTATRAEVAAMLMRLVNLMMQ